MGKKHPDYKFKLLGAAWARVILFWRSACSCRTLTILYSIDFYCWLDRFYVAIYVF